VFIQDQLAFCLDVVNVTNGLNNQTKVWSAYQPDAPPPLQTLNRLAPGGGYFINANADCHVAFGLNHITIYEGWNLLGWR
jgi:hypothetical protein